MVDIVMLRGTAFINTRWTLQTSLAPVRWENGLLQRRYKEIDHSRGHSARYNLNHGTIVEWMQCIGAAGLATMSDVPYGCSTG